MCSGCDRPTQLHEVEEAPDRCSCDPDDPDHECPPNLHEAGPLSTVCLWGDCVECDGISNPDDVEGYRDGFAYGEDLVLCSHACHEWDEVGP